MSEAVDIAALSARLQRLEAHEQIRQLVFGYARALDRLDAALLEQLFWPDAQVDYGTFYRGPVAGFLPIALAFQGAMRDTQHLIGNCVIQLDSGADTARAESYVQASHVQIEGETRVQLLVGARYLDRFERRGSEWRIAYRTEVLDWGRRLNITEEWFERSTEMPKGCRDRTDLSYGFLPGIRP